MVGLAGQGRQHGSTLPPNMTHTSPYHPTHPHPSPTPPTPPSDWCDEDHVESMLNQRNAKMARQMLNNLRLSCCVAGHVDLTTNDQCAATASPPAALQRACCSTCQPHSSAHACCTPRPTHRMKP